LTLFNESNYTSVLTKVWVPPLLAGISPSDSGGDWLGLHATRQLLGDRRLHANFRLLALDGCAALSQSTKRFFHNYCEQLPGSTMQTRSAMKNLTLFALTAMLLAAFSVASPALVHGQVGFEARELAPGVLKTIPTILDVRDSFSLPMPLPGIDAQPYQPQTLPRQVTLHERSRRVVLFRDVWQYEFSFTGLRQMSQQVRLSDGRIAQDNIWYMVYRVRNLGKSLGFEQVKENPNFDRQLFELQNNKAATDKKVDFLPRFTIEGWVIPAEKRKYEKAVYRDFIDPALVKLVQQREDPGRRLLSTVEMSRAELPVIQDEAADGVWGVAIWRDVDPRIDYLSVFVSGLTNAYRINKDAKGDIDLKQKTLQLNFWRPGDTVSESDDNVDYGIPLVNDARRQVLITQRYALPGPVLRVYHESPTANRSVLIAEADGQVSLETFKSAITPTLDQGELPEPVAVAIEASGLEIPGNVGLKTLIPGQKWSMNMGEEAYTLALEPQYWEPDFGKIRFIKSLDHLWIYR
jgi:hypothetical protein